MEGGLGLALSLLAALTLLVWGGYGTVFVQTSPSDQGSIINSVLNREGPIASSFPGNGTSVGPGLVSQFIIQFETSIPPSVGTGTYDLPGEGGIVFTPVLFSSIVSNDSSYQVLYAVFTFSFCAKSGCFYSIGANGNIWVSGPQGNISQHLDTNSYGGVDSGGPLLYTLIVQVETPGNYTLHVWNTTSAGNYTAKVAMGPSSVLFSRSRPYLYPGIATVFVAVAFSAAVATLFWRKLKQQPQPETSQAIKTG